MEGTGRDITASVIRCLLRYLERAIGPAAARAAFLDGGVDPGDLRIDDDAGWFSVGELEALADAAIAATGDREVGRRLGEEHFRRDEALGNVDFLLAEGDPGRAVAYAAAHTGRMVTVRDYVLVTADEHQVVVESRALVPHARHPVHCQMLAGYWSHIPGLFGALGTVVEPLCCARGDDRCRIVVRWDRTAVGGDEQLARSRRRTAGLVHRFEEMQALAAEMASVTDLSEALRRIVARAGSALLAQRFLLTVGTRGAVPEVFAAGLTDADAQAVADLLWAGVDRDALAGEHESLGTPLLAEVVVHGSAMGYLVAFVPPGAAVREFDSRLLEAYARHAAATIERIVSAEAAAREHRSVQVLLELAGSLAGARTVDEVTAQVTDAVTAVTGCDAAGVWLLDPSGSHYQLQVVRGSTPPDAPRRLPIVDPEAAAVLAADPRPFVIGPDDEPELDDLLAAWEVVESFVAPIVHRGVIHGLLASSFQHPVEPREHKRLLASVSALAHHAGTAIGNTVLFAQIRHQAMHDALTGLPNRPQIEERVAEALHLAERHGGTAAIAFVDLDRFKVVNDSLGHVAGDALIGQVADRLSQRLRPTDVVARLGGDEFLVLLSELESEEQAEEVVGRLLDGLREPFEVDGESLYVTASAGIACYPAHGEDYGTLLGRADAAMYMAKSLGRNQFAVHRASGAGGRSRLKLERELHDAVERDELRVVYQPQVDLMTDEIVAVEALVRWQHPELGLLGPESFLSMAEETGLVVEVDRWVRRSALRQAAAWCDAGTPIRTAVNVSRRDLSDPCFAEDVGRLLSELDLDPELIELEITDRIVMSDEDLPPSLASLRSLGVRLAVDDFGTGSSVLSRLHHCPVDVLKVDRTFVQPFSRPRPDTRLVDGLVSMAHALGMEVVVEGIEDEQQAHAVRLLGADLGQGFHLHRPMPADELTALLELHEGQTGLVPVRSFGRRSRRRVRR